VEVDVMVALLAFLGTAVGTLGGIMTSSRLTTFRLKKLEEKVDAHNNLVERMVAVEERAKSNTHRIDELDEDIDKLRKTG
jgi:hypothetical protein